MEIERKWLVRKENIPYDLSSLECHKIEQFYISQQPTIRARKIDDSKYILTIKTKPSNTDEIARNEVEIPLCEQEYENLLDKRIGKIISKNRYINDLKNGLVEEIDIFEGYLDGLAYLEIEFDHIENAKSYPDPVWIEKDVTYEDKYKNGALALCSDVNELI